MKKESKLKHLFVSLVMLGCSFGFTACDKNKDDPAKEPLLTDVYGNYLGKMTTAVTPATYDTGVSTEGEDISATVNNDTVTFAKFPVENIIKAILQDVPEEGVGAIIGLLGDVKYEIGYKAEFNAAKDGISMTFDPKPLILAVPTPTLTGEVQSVTVSVSADEKGSYAVEGKTLKFSIKVTGVTVDGDDFPVPPMTFSFNMNKK
ncbi:MAG: DUF4840 domain-containing protein [Tannerella sp.]|jgi:hypothetical protein|nr:DUF4840 domain-containing protein [Tannerella sp.]